MESYHENIETSRRFFPYICTTHTYDQKVESIRLAKAEGFCVCSGGIIGMGETWEDRLDMAVSLAELAFHSGASATITGNMLTTSGSSIAGDKAMLTAMGRDIIAEYLK